MGNKLEGFDSAPIYDRLPDFEAGKYVAEVVEMSRFMATGDEEGEYFKTRWRVLEASPGSGTAPGDEVNTLISLFGKYKKSNFGRVRSIVGAVTDAPGSTITVEDLDEATAEDNPCKGSKVRVYAVPAKSKAGNNYAQCTFTTYRPPAAVAKATSAEAST